MWRGPHVEQQAISALPPSIYGLAEARDHRDARKKRSRRENFMKFNFRFAFAAAAAFGLGAISMQALKAESKPPAYSVLEVDVTNQDAYMKEFAPIATKAIEAAGGKFLVRGGKTVVIEGSPPKGRIVVSAFDSLEQAQAALASPAYLDARKIGDKYATFRTFLVEGLAK
jgi:uncharacterized protein (DUF1330 family)